VGSFRVMRVGLCPGYFQLAGVLGGTVPCVRRFLAEPGKPPASRLQSRGWESATTGM
jgi:hypothetical protein